MTEAQLSDKTTSEIRKLSDVALANQNYLSLKDVALLTSVNLTAAELRAKWDSMPELSSSYKLEHDLILDRRMETAESSTAMIAVVREKCARAIDYLSLAKAFVALSHSTLTRLISVSGSTSYFSAASKDDLDFFVVSAKDNLWIFLFKSLVLARVFRLFHPRSPRICFSYAVDEALAERMFAQGDPLLARDVLNVIVVRGEGYYRNLVGKSEWIAKYFPRLYGLKTAHPARTEDRPPIRASAPRRSLNLFLFLVLGRYIRVKSDLLNRQFLRAGKTQSLFSFRAGPDHCIFDSHRYSTLREIYNRQNQTVLRKPDLRVSPPGGVI